MKPCATGEQKLRAGRIFFTVNLAERQRCLLVEHIDVLCAAVKSMNVRLVRYRQ